MTVEIDRPASSPPTVPARPGSVMSTTGQMSHLLAVAMSHNADHPAWDEVLAFALGVEVRLYGHAVYRQPANPGDNERHRLARLVLENYRGAMRRQEETTQL